MGGRGEREGGWGGGVLFCGTSIITHYLTSTHTIISTRMASSDSRHQAYLDAHGINPLFIDIVEGLLTNTPDNHVQYIVDYLHKNHPDQLATASKPKYVVVKDEGDDSDDDDEDEIGNMIESLPPPKAPRARRTSVSAESMDAKKQ